MGVKQIWILISKIDRTRTQMPNKFNFIKFKHIRLKRKVREQLKRSTENSSPVSLKMPNVGGYNKNMNQSNGNNATQKEGNSTQTVSNNFNTNPDQQKNRVTPSANGAQKRSDPIQINRSGPYPTRGYQPNPNNNSMANVVNPGIAPMSIPTAPNNRERALMEALGRVQSYTSFYLAMPNDAGHLARTIWHLTGEITSDMSMMNGSTTVYKK